MKLFLRFLPPIAVAALLAVMGVALLRPANQSNTGNGTSLAGKAAPDFELQTLEGKTLRLSSLRGKAVVLNFWASWCEPCKDEAPMLSKRANELKANGVVLLGVAYNDKKSDIENFRKTYAIGFPLLNDESNRVSVLYGLRGVPESFFIDKNGAIVSRYFGPLDEKILDARLKGLQ